MFITESLVAEMVTRYGAPVVKDFVIPSSVEDIQGIRKSTGPGRNHDVTVYVRKDNTYLVIAKHVYTPGMYRAMSGGIHEGETMENGLRREVREELGCEIDIERFLLRTNVRFVADTDQLHWRSFVFLANWKSGDLNFTDKKEIREVRLATFGDFASFGQAMRERGTAGLRYRAALHEAVAPFLD